MRLFSRGPVAPAEVVARAGLGRGEKVLAASRARDGVWLLGTRAAMLMVGADDANRLPWQQVENAEWDRDAERLLVREVGEFGRLRPVHSFGIDEPGLLLELVRERVTASVVLQRRVTIAGKTGFTVIARRSPADTGEITWAFELDPGVDPEDPEVQAATELALQTAAEEIGL